MTMVEQVRPAACPACAVSPLAEELAQKDADKGQILLSLPTIHCAACISAVERGLSGVPGVRAARVNLTLKRASIDAAANVTTDQLIEVLEGLGYPAHELDPGLLSTTASEKAGKDLLLRLAVSGFAMMNVMLLSVSVWSGAEAATRDLFHWISAAITLPTIAFAAQPFFKSAWMALSKGRLNMDVPISLAIGLAVVTSLWETTLSGEHAYFDAALALRKEALGEDQGREDQQVLGPLVRSQQPHDSPRQRPAAQCGGGGQAFGRGQVAHVASPVRSGPSLIAPPSPKRRFY